MSAQRINRFRSVIALCAAIALAYTSFFAVGVPKAQALAIGDKISVTTGLDLRETDSEGNFTNPYGSTSPDLNGVLSPSGTTRIALTPLRLFGVGGGVPAESQLEDPNNPVPGIFGYSLEYYVPNATSNAGEIVSWDNYSLKGISVSEDTKKSSKSDSENKDEYDQFAYDKCNDYFIYCNSNLSRQKDVKEKVTWIVNNSYPKKALKDLPGFTEPGGLSYRDAIAATQTAIWHFTDQLNGLGLIKRVNYGDDDDEWKWDGKKLSTLGNYQLDQNAKPGARKLYEYLTGDTNRGMGEQNPACDPTGALVVNGNLSNFILTQSNPESTEQCSAPAQSQNPQNTAADPNNQQPDQNAEGGATNNEVNVTTENPDPAAAPETQPTDSAPTEGANPEQQNPAENAQANPVESITSVPEASTPSSIPAVPQPGSKADTGVSSPQPAPKIDTKSGQPAADPSVQVNVDSAKVNTAKPDVASTVTLAASAPGAADGGDAVVNVNVNAPTTTVTNPKTVTSAATVTKTATSTRTTTQTATPLPQTSQRVVITSIPSGPTQLAEGMPLVIQ